MAKKSTTTRNDSSAITKATEWGRWDHVTTISHSDGTKQIGRGRTPGESNRNARRSEPK